LNNLQDGSAYCMYELMSRMQNFTMKFNCLQDWAVPIARTTWH
jgi:hypothetical protein